MKLPLIGITILLVTFNTFANFSGHFRPIKEKCTDL